MKGPFDIEEVVDPIGVKISDAIMNFQRSGYEVSERVKQECGTPRIQKREVILLHFACFHIYGKAKFFTSREAAWSCRTVGRKE